VEDADAAFAEELKFQTGGATRAVTFSIKARSAITMAGHKGSSATWIDPPGTCNFIRVRDHAVCGGVAKKNPVARIMGRPGRCCYRKPLISTTKLPLEREPWTVDDNVSHALRGKEGSAAPDAAYYEQWATSPFADTYLTKLAETAVDSIGLGKSKGTDFLGVSYSSVDYVGHAFGPRSREIQDILVRLDKDLEISLHFWTRM